MPIPYAIVEISNSLENFLEKEAENYIPLLTVYANKCYNNNLMKF